MFSGVIAKLRSLLCNAAKAVREALRPRPCSVVAGLAAGLLRSRSEPVTENVLLRQQLIVAVRKVKKPAFQRHERTLITLLAAVLPRWRDALLLVKPETVLRWHSEGFRLLWRWKSRSTKTPVCRISPVVVELIRRMATENRLHALLKRRIDPAGVVAIPVSLLPRRMCAPPTAAPTRPARLTLNHRLE